MTHYYGGLKVQPATIFKLRPTTFAQLVQEKFDLPVQLQITREEFHALSPDEQFKVKNGPYICAVSFKEGTTHRCDANADQLTLICLDIDDSDQARDFVESPEEVLEAFYPWNVVLHHTATSTPENPRLRVVLPVEAPLNRHKDGVAYSANLLGLPAKFKGVRESGVLSQPWFFPIAFHDEEPNAILASRTNGRTLTDADIPVATVEEGDERTYAYSPDVFSDLSYLPVQDLTVEDIREPLFAIDSDVTYGQWTMIASALRHQFREEEAARDAYQLFDEWSQRGTKYKGEEDTWAKWKSFKPDTVGKNPRTIRSLFHFAQDAGWKPTKVAAKIRISIEEWIAKCDDPDVLLSEGVKLIADLPFKLASTEELLRKRLAARHLVLAGVKPSEKSLMRDVSDARFKAKEAAQADDKPKWLRTWCFISTQNIFRNVLTGEKLIPAAFNLSFGKHLMPTDGELAKTGKPIMLPTDFAMNVQTIKTCGGVTYDPRQKESSPLEPFFTHEGVEYLNEYRVSSLPKLDPANAKKVGGYFKQHLRTIIKEPEYADIILYFFAYLVQFPGEKLGWCPVIQSAQGAGKSTLIALAGAALGDPNVSMVNPSTMKQTWNDWAFGYQLIGLEEIKVHGHARAEIMNGLKDVMTNEKVTVNKRHTDARADLNLVNFIGFTNYPDALYLEEDDRRYMFIRSQLDTKEKVKALTATGYFDALYEIVRTGGGALRSYLLNVKIPDSFPRKGPAPDTVYRCDVVAESKNHLQADIEEQIEGDNPLIGTDIISYAELETSLPHQKDNYQPSHFLQLMNYQRYEAGKRFMVNGVRTVIWVHRDNYDEMFGPAEEILRIRANALD